MTWVLPWLVRWANRAGTRDFWSALAPLVGLVQNIFFPIVHIFNSSVPIVQQYRPAVRQGHLSLYACLCVSFNYNLSGQAETSVAF
jgi:hypothetical protein